MFCALCFSCKEIQLFLWVLHFIKYFHLLSIALLEMFFLFFLLHWTGWCTTALSQQVCVFSCMALCQNTYDVTMVFRWFVYTVCGLQPQTAAKRKQTLTFSVQIWAEEPCSHSARCRWWNLTVDVLKCSTEVQIQGVLTWVFPFYSTWYFYATTFQR